MKLEDIIIGVVILLIIGTLGSLAIQESFKARQDMRRQDFQRCELVLSLVKTPQDSIYVYRRMPECIEKVE